MKKTFRRTLILFLIILSIWTIQGLYRWSNCNCTNGDIKHGWDDDEKSMIAWFSSENATFPKLRIARFKVQEPYKYPFFSPQYYSDFFLFDIERFDSLIFILDNRDTLRAGILRQINKVPFEIKVCNFAMTKVAMYRPDTIYLDNLNNKPSISFFTQIVLFGPSFDEFMDKCN